MVLTLEVGYDVVGSGTRMVGLGTLRTSFEAVAETSAGLPYGLLSDRR